MIKCEAGKVTFEVTEEDINSIVKAIPATSLLGSLLEDGADVFAKTVETTIFTSDLATICYCLIDEYGKDAGVEMITLAVKRVLEEVKESKVNE